MKKGLLLFFALICICVSQVKAEGFLTYVSTPGTLSQKVVINSLIPTEDLIISGKINYDDLSYIKNQLPNIREINLSMCEYSDETIPASYFQGFTALEIFNFPLNVTSVEDGSFKNINTLTKVKFSAKTKSIGNEAFMNCNKLNNITGIFNIEHIGNSAFENCVELVNVDFACMQRLNSIGSSAFFKTAIISAQLNKSVTEIGSQAFSESMLESVYMPQNNTLTDISDKLFNKCLNLIEVRLPPNTRNIGLSAFQSCIKINRIDFPNTLTSIGDNAFNECSGLTYIVINSIPTLGTDALNLPQTNLKFLFPQDLIASAMANPYFGGKTLKQQITGTLDWTLEEQFNALPNKDEYVALTLTGTCFNNEFVNRINNFLNLKSLNVQNLTFTNNTIPVFFLGNNKIIETVTLPDNIESISNEAFKDCLRLTTVNISGNSIKNINNFAFFNCYNLTNISPMPILENLSGGVFFNCSSLQAFTLPNTLKSIGDNCFSKCYALTSMNIPSSMAQLGYNIFSNCYNISTITFDNSFSLPELTETMFSSCYSLANITLPSSIKKIGNGCFRSCFSLTNIDWTNTPQLNTIDSGAFSECISLNISTIPNTVTTIGEMAFGICLKITDFTIPTTITTIPMGLFYGNTSLKNINIHKDITDIGAYAFNSCGSLSQITFEENSKLTNIGIGAFASCSTLQTVTLPNSVISISTLTFFNCTSLTQIDIPNTVEYIGGQAFMFCTALKSFKFPTNNNFTTINEFAFLNDTALSTISIPANVTIINNLAFQDCISLTKIVNLATTPQTIDNTVFANVNPANCSLYVPTESLQAYKDKSIWNSFLVKVYDPTGITNTKLTGANIDFNNGELQIKSSKPMNNVELLSNNGQKIGSIQSEYSASFAAPYSGIVIIQITYKDGTSDIVKHICK